MRTYYVCVTLLFLLGHLGLLISFRTESKYSDFNLVRPKQLSLLTFQCTGDFTVNIWLLRVYRSVHYTLQCIEYNWECICDL